MSALRGTVQHISGYDPRCIEVALDGGGHDLKPDDEVAVHAVKHAGAEAGETFGQVLGEMLGDAYGAKVIEQLADLEAIVRDLAKLRSFRDDLGFAFECRCPTVDHADTCPWRRARDWVSAHPETETAGG